MVTNKLYYINKIKLKNIEIKASFVNLHIKYNEQILIQLKGQFLKNKIISYKFYQIINFVSVNQWGRVTKKERS